MKISLSSFFLFLFISLSMISCSEEETENLSQTGKASISTYTYNSGEDEVLSLINSYRSEKGLSVLEKMDYISVKCEEHSEYMISAGVVSHDNFGERASIIMKNLRAESVSENLAYKYSTAESVVKAWLYSNEHRVNIEGDFTHFGISIRKNKDGVRYYTNIFIKK